MITELETVKPDFLTEEYKLKLEDFPPMYRMNYNHSRYYVTAEGGEVDWYSSVTSIIGQVVPKSVGMELLMMSKGTEFNTWMAELAHQGTFIHNQIGNYLLRRELAKDYADSETFLIYSFFDFEDEIKKYFLEKRLNYDVKKWDIELKPKIVSLIRFIEEYEVEPLAVEMIVRYKDELVQYAGALDLLCFITVEEEGEWGELYKSGVNRGLPKITKKKVRKLAIIDFKSGTSGFFPEYGIQLQMYAKALYQMIGLNVDAIMNVAPTKFMNGNTPGYSVKDWKELVNKEKLNDILRMFSRDYSKPDQIVSYDGEINPGGSIESIFRYQKADEFVLGLSKVQKTQELETQLN